MSKIRIEENYDFSLLRSKQQALTGETGAISVALAQNIASKKVPSLFLETRDKKLLELKAIDERRLVNREGKPTFLTRRQNKLVFALAMCLSQRKDEPEIREYVKKINEGKQPNSRITLPISITELTKTVTTDGNARARQKEDVLEDLKALSEIKQVQTFGGYSLEESKEEGKLRFIASLINIPEQVEDFSEGRKLDADFVFIQFGSIFFYQLYNRYAIVKPKLFQMWGKAGSGTDTELFDILLSDLLAKYSGHRIAGIQALATVKRKDYKTDESYYKARNKVLHGALTYSEYASTIQERVTTGYGDSREQKRRFYRDLDKAIVALKEYGLITGAKVVQTNKGDRVDFTFNIDYDKQEEAVLLPGDLEIETSEKAEEQDGTLFPAEEGSSEE
jgi:hypothetical protein